MTPSYRSLSPLPGTCGRWARSGSEKIARELPATGRGAYPRDDFGEDLALIDLLATLELFRDQIARREYTVPHGNLTHKLAGLRSVESQECPFTPSYGSFLSCGLVAASNSARSFLKSSRGRRASRSASFFNWVAFLYPCAIVRRSSCTAPAA